MDTLPTHSVRSAPSSFQRRVSHVGVVAVLGSALFVVACGDKKGSDASGSSAPASTATTATTTASGTSSAKPAAAAPAAGSDAELRDKAMGVMAALKAGDATAAAAFCLGKHHDAFQKWVQEKLDEGKTRAQAFKAWDGKLGEMRVEGDLARVEYSRDDQAKVQGVEYLSFRKKDGTWSLDDIPSTSKEAWAKWGKVVTP